MDKKVFTQIDLPQDLLSVNKIKMISDNKTEDYTYGGEDFDIYNLYEITGNKMAESIVTPNFSNIPRHGDITPQRTFYTWGNQNDPIVSFNRFQVIKKGEATYISVLIPGYATRVEFYDSLDTLVGHINIDREDAKDVEFYLRFVSESGRTTDFIDINDFMSDDVLDYLGGTSVGKEFPTVKQYYDVVLRPVGSISKDTVGLKSIPHNHKVTKDKGIKLKRSEEIFKNLYEPEDVPFYMDGIVYKRGDVVRLKYGGKKYTLSTDRVSNSNPLTSKVWVLP